jgi:hypothetical protein
MVCLFYRATRASHTQSATGRRSYLLQQPHRSGSVSFGTASIVKREAAKGSDYFSEKIVALASQDGRNFATRRPAVFPIAPKISNLSCSNHRKSVILIGLILEKR